MRIVFMGTPIFATAILKQLIEDQYEIVGVISQPDKKVGRKQVVTFTPVKELALQHNIEVYQPTSIKEGLTKIETWCPDLIVTCAYGQLIPEYILNYPTFGSLNVHASLLPKLRGGAPIHKALIDGYEKTGVSIMRMVKRMDAGAYMLQEQVEITLEDTQPSLHDKLQVCGANAIAKAIPLLVDGKATFIEQDESQVTYAYNISKEEELIDPNQSMKQVYNHIRGLIGWPVAYYVVNEKKIKFHEIQYTEQICHYSAGSLYVENKKLYLACSDGCIEIKQLQLEGKSKCLAIDFINGAGRQFIQLEKR